MALLSKPGGGSPVALPAHTLVGRSSACTLRIEDRLASGEHARLSFADGTWTVRDLASRNGTWLDGSRIEPGGTRELREGSRLAFGNVSAPWDLIDASPPVAMARRSGDDTLFIAQDGMLALPSADEPEACVFESRGVWTAEIDGDSRPTEDGEILLVAGQSYKLHLPVAGQRTEDASAASYLDEVALSLRVSRNEEQVEVVLSGRSGVRALVPRSHHYTLLILARARQKDEDTPSLKEPQRGWRHVDDLCRSLAIDENRLNVEIHRIRQDFARAGLSDATTIVERRSGSRLLRLGTARVTIAPLG
ncbi:MAG: FHA domain-containing protein [Polyangiaceae bacterium]